MQIHLPRHDHNSGTPSHAAATASIRRGVRHVTILGIEVLRVGYIVNPLVIERRHIEVHHRGLGCHLSIARVSQPFAMAAIHRHTAVDVAQLPPHIVVMNAVEQIVGARELRQFVHRGIDSTPLDAFPCEFTRPSTHDHILESEPCETRLIHFLAIAFEDVRDRGVYLIAKGDLVALLIDLLREIEHYLCPRRSTYFEANPSREVLTEVHKIACRQSVQRLDRLRLEGCRYTIRGTHLRTQLPHRRARDRTRIPCRVIEARRAPSWHLQPGIVYLTTE